MPNIKIEFEKKKGTAKEVVFEIKAFTEYHNRNGMYFTFSDLLNGAEKIPVKETHNGKVFANTYLVDREIREEKQGRVLYGKIVSTDPDFISKADKITAFSIEGDPLSGNDVFVNASGELAIKEGRFDFQAIAALFGELPGSGGTEILNKKYKFNILKKLSGSEKVPQNNFKNSNNINMEMTEQKLAELIANSTAQAVEAKFSEIKKKQEEAKKISFSINKDKATAESIIKFAKEKFGFELVEKTEEESEAGELEKQLAKAERMQFAKSSKRQKAGGNSGEPEENTNILNFLNKF